MGLKYKHFVSKVKSLQLMGPKSGAFLMYNEGNKVNSKITQIRICFTY